MRNLTDFGAFIEIEDGIDGLVHVSNLSWTKRVKHPSEVLKKGEKVKAVVLGVEPENRRLSLGIKQLQPDVWETFFAQHRVGDVVHGKVLRTAQFGAFVEIAEGVEGLCHVSEAVDDARAPVKLEQGQEHEFKIIKMNQEEKKVGLSLRAVGEEASRAEVESYKAENQSSHRDRHNDKIFVSVKTRHPADDAEKEAFRARFLKERLFGGGFMFGGRTTYDYLNMPQQQQLAGDWMQRLYTKYRVPQFRRGTADAPAQHPSRRGSDRRRHFPSVRWKNSITTGRRKGMRISECGQWPTRRQPEIADLPLAAMAQL